MIGRQLALAGVAVDEPPLHVLGQRLAHQHEVDAHAPVVVEVAGPVVPVREQLVGVGIEQPEGVLQAPVLEAGDGVALGLGDVGRPDEGGRVPHVAVLGRHVEVAAHDHGLIGVGGVLEVRPHPVEPRELVLVVVAVDGAAVGHVHARHPDAAAAWPLMSRVSWSASSPSQNPLTGSSMPTLLRMATPFHWPLPWWTLS